MSMSRFCIYFSFVDLFNSRNRTMTSNGGYALNGNQPFQNLTGTSLEMCSNAPLTGYFRNGKSFFSMRTIHRLKIFQVIVQHVLMIMVYIPYVHK